MLRLTSKKTLPILLEALRRLRFTQTELAEAKGISVGRVNKVVNWLKEKDIITKETGQYVLAQPNRLADLIATEQTISKTRTYLVTAEPQRLLQEVREAGAQSCLESALDGSEREIHLMDTEEARTYLDTLPRGELRVHLYDYPAHAKEEMDDVRTIIDLKSAGKGYLAEDLAMKTWGTRQ